MSNADVQYNSLIEDIILNGIWDKDQNVRTKYADGTPAYTKSIFGVQIKFDENEVPILTEKKVAWKTAIKEMLLFWVKQTTRKKDFHDVNVHVWDEWFLNDDTIGKSYSYQFESRPKKEIIKVNVRKKQHHGDLKKILVGERELPNHDCNDDYCGKIISSNNYGDFMILDVLKYKDNNEKVITRWKIQFLDTNYITMVDSKHAKYGNVKDPYARKVFGVGYDGDLTKIRNFSKEEIDKFRTRWHRILDRCYTENHSYNLNGVFVDERWHCFANFLEDIRYIPQFFLAKEDEFNNWDIDKDYYGSNCYSKETCVWITTKENDHYRHKPFVVNKNGEEKVFFTVSSAANFYNIDRRNFNKMLEENKEIKNLTARYIEENTGYVYRYKISKNQVIELINQIKNNPSSRRLMTSFWNYEDVEDKALQECAFQTHWRVQNNKLHLILTQRSGDLGLGVPFNQFQYYVLQCMIAQVCDLEVGTFTHHIGDLHIYDRHVEPLTSQLDLPQYEAPKLKINTDVKDFFNFNINDFELLNYEHGPNIKMEVAI